MPCLKYQNVASDEYDKYDKCIRAEMQRYIISDIAHIISDYAIVNKYEHFRAVMAVAPRVFGFVRKYNQIINPGTIWRDADNPIWLLIDPFEAFDEDIWDMIRYVEKMRKSWRYKKIRKESVVANQYRQNAKRLLSEASPRDT